MPEQLHLESQFGEYISHGKILGPPLVKTISRQRQNSQLDVKRGTEISQPWYPEL